METEKLALLIPILAILVSGVALVYALWTKNRENLAMIEKGLDPNSFRTKRPVRPYSSAKWALLLIGLAVGLLVGALLSYFTRLDEDTLMFSCILLFGGLGLLSYSLVFGRKAAQKE